MSQSSPAASQLKRLLVLVLNLYLSSASAAPLAQSFCELFLRRPTFETVIYDHYRGQVTSNPKLASGPVATLMARTFENGERGLMLYQSQPGLKNRNFACVPVAVANAAQAFRVALGLRPVKNSALIKAANRVTENKKFANGVFLRQFPEFVPTIFSSILPGRKIEVETRTVMEDHAGEFKDGARIDLTDLTVGQERIQIFGLSYYDPTTGKSNAHAVVLTKMHGSELELSDPNIPGIPVKVFAQLAQYNVTEGTATTLRLAPADDYATYWLYEHERLSERAVYFLSEILTIKLSPALF